MNVTGGMRAESGTEFFLRKEEHQLIYFLLLEHQASTMTINHRDRTSDDESTRKTTEPLNGPLPLTAATAKFLYVCLSLPLAKPREGCGSLVLSHRLCWNSLFLDGEPLKQRANHCGSAPDARASARAPES